MKARQLASDETHLASDETLAGFASGRLDEGMALVVAAHIELNQASGRALRDIEAIGGGAVADRQWRAFAHNPATQGKVCDTGLWAWSRHPNYFFECVRWCAYPVIAIAATG